MNKIQVSNLNPYNGPNGSLRLSFAGEGDGWDDSYDPTLAAYHAQLDRYAQSLMSYYSSLSTGDPRRSTVEAYRKQTAAFAEQYGFEDIFSEVEGSQWDPLAGNLSGDLAGELGKTGMDSSNSLSALPLPTLPDPQDPNANYVGWDDDVPQVTASRKDYPGKDKKFYGYGDVSFTVPGAANATVTSEVDTQTHKTSVVVTVTWPDGASQRYIFANSKHVKILAASPDDQVNIDASAPAGRVEKGEIGSGDQASEEKGDAPVTRTDGKLGWDGSSFDVWSRSDGQEKWISARDVVNFHATSNTEFWTVAWDKDIGQYVIRVFANKDDQKDPKNAKETFHVDDMTNLKIAFDIDPTHIDFMDSLAGNDSHQINASDEHGKKLSFQDGSQNTTRHPGEPLHEGDTPPDLNSISKGEGTWTRGNSNVEIHADPTDGVNLYHIHTTGIVLLHGATPNDQVDVGQIDNGSRTITFTSPDGTKKSFVIEGPPSKIILDSLSDKVSGAGMDQVSLGNSFDVGHSQFKDLMQSLEDATGADEETILKQVRKYFPEIKAYDEQVSKGGNNDGKLDLDELEKAYEAGKFPSKMPDQSMIQFLYAIDGDFQNAVNGITIEPNMAQMRIATQELVKALSALYPDVSVRAANPNAVGNDWKMANDILFGNGKFQFTGESNDSVNSIAFQWLNEPS